MANVIKITKGLSINLKGKPSGVVKGAVPSAVYTIFPDDFVGLIPKVAVRQGDKILAGDPVLFDKNHPENKITSPVSGEILEVKRGEKRKLLCVTIKADDQQYYKDFGVKNVSGMSPETIKLTLAEAGIFAYIKQRPYDIVANPENTPRDIFISAYNTAPLAPDVDFILSGQLEDFQTGIDALAKLTEGKVFLGVPSQSKTFSQVKNAIITSFEGSHPAGNVGVQINHIKPINKGDLVWTLDPMTVIYIGRLFNKGKVDFTRLVALTGSEVNENARAYYPMLPGASIENLVRENVSKNKHLRYISGNVLTGIKMTADDSLHAHDGQVTVIPEGDETNELFGWIMPRCNDFSVSKTYPAFLFNLLGKKEYALDARVKGGKRAMIMSNEWDKVFPMDILPEFLIRAILAFDIDKMENLGIYEVAPEDFALCEFVDTSKMELQSIVRKGLDLLYKEMM